jgi:hypothetical protein
MSVFVTNSSPYLIDPPELHPPYQMKKSIFEFAANRVVLNEYLQPPRMPFIIRTITNTKNKIKTKLLLGTGRSKESNQRSS